MTNPPLISNDEKKMLKKIKHTSQYNPTLWSSFEVDSGLDFSTFANSIAHFVQNDFIVTSQVRQGFFKTILGKDPDYYVFITPAGKTYLDEYGHTTAEDDARLAELNATPEDKMHAIVEATRHYEDSFSKEPIYSPEKAKKASSMLDEDIKVEIEKAALEIETMWDEYEIRFGHRGAAESQAQSDFRDPVVKIATVRTYRAIDEQLRRKNLPMSSKPTAWMTHYNGGDVGLKPAQWEMVAK